VDDPVWVADAVVAAIHKRQLAEHGGAEGVRDPGPLASALARPRHLAAHAPRRVSLGQLAAAYAFGIARNHPFADGNKRTALVVSLLFLRLNGCTVTASAEGRLAVFVALADGSLTEDALASWFDAHLQPA
jgi:death-on-curing protein